MFYMTELCLQHSATVEKRVNSRVRYFQPSKILPTINLGYFQPSKILLTVSEKKFMYLIKLLNYGFTQEVLYEGTYFDDEKHIFGKKQYGCFQLC